MIVYLHGFRSSPDSAKALQLKSHVEASGERWYCPQLPASPQLAIEQVMAHLDHCADDHLAVIGASLGGLYATWIAEQLNCRAVLLNPMTKMPPHPEQFVGQTTDIAGRDFIFTSDYIKELQRFVVPKITRPERYLLLASTADEVLNWHDMAEHFQGAEQILIEGDSHRMVHFERYIDQVLAFAQRK